MSLNESIMKHMMMKESVYSVGIEKGWTKKQCQIKFIQMLAIDGGIELTEKEALGLLKDDPEEYE